MLVKELKEILETLDDDMRVCSGFRDFNRYNRSSPPIEIITIEDAYIGKNPDGEDIPKDIILLY